MKIEIAQISTDPGYIEENTKKIIRVIKEARKDKADLVIFPELAIPGYMSLDLVLYKGYIKKNLDALKMIAKHTQKTTVVVGFIDWDKNKTGPDGTPTRYNSAAIIQNGKIIGVEDKTLLPNYDVFFEGRYFAPARKRQVYKIGGLKVGIEICEDLWDKNYPIKVSDELIKKGAEVLINISASPFYIGKRQVREKLVKRVVAKHKVPFIYVNTVGSQDGYDGQLVFDGQSLAYSANNEPIGLGKAFQEDQFLIDLNYPKMIENQYLKPIEELHLALVSGIREYFRRTGFTKAVIGLSGGIDSALVTALATEALGPENVRGISMPSQFSSKGSIDDAKALASNLKIDFSIIPIEDAFKSFEQTLSEEFSNKDTGVAEENIQARIRGIILMAEANKFGYLVISTGNKTETALGYTTLYGDMCGGLAAISDVSKLRVYELAEYINKRAGREIIPQNTINKAPSAELRIDQTDESSLGASYAVISPLVDKLVEERKTINELSREYPEKIVRHLAELIVKNEYKRRQAPPGIKVTPKAFGIGRRVPLVHNFKD